jgi:membrane-associated phospholipid phosphatase
MQKIIARFISIVFHPLITITIFTFLFIKNVYGLDVAKTVLYLIGIVAVLPIVTFSSIQLFRGKISNFDLSNSAERNATYPKLLLILLILISSGIYISLPAKLIYALSLYSLMIFVFYFFRNKLKISLHASTSFFLASMIVFSFLGAGVIAIVISLLVAISRLILKRHTLAEVIVGGSCGLLLGSVAGLMQ